MIQYDVTGMSCAACSARVEKAVSQVPGVTQCAVNLLTNSMSVEGTASPEEVIRAVTQAGYGASLQGQNSSDSAGGSRKDALQDRETPALRRRLIASSGFLLLLMYLSMGHMMGSWPVPAFLQGNPMALGLMQLLLSGIILVINQKFFVSGFQSLWRRAPNMDTLVALGSGASFGWSVVCLFLMTTAQLRGDADAVMESLHNLYFESAAMILTLITVGKMLEARSKGKTTDAIKALIELSPQTAAVEREGREITLPVDQVTVGDVFLVRPGESIPVDGIILEGNSAVNEAALTGESIPADKGPGDQVSAATINQSGFLRCRATRVGQDTTLSQIIRMVSDASASKAPIAKVADRVSGIFVPGVISLSLITLVVWLLLGREFSYALARAISVLVISCPCALGLATPVAIMVGSGVGARNGILFKTAVSLEETGKTDVVVLDKTGTITSGHPKVTDVVPVPGQTEQSLVQLALDLEAKSEHPLAKAILSYGESHAMTPNEVENFTALPGNGLSAGKDGQMLLGGSMEFIASRAAVSKEMEEKARLLAQEGKTPLLFCRGNTFCGMIAVADAIKEDSPAAIARLHSMGIHVVMLTGDNRRTAEAIGRQAGVDEVIAGVLPEGKEREIRRLKQSGKVTMVGDGINDAPALTRADIGIAIGAGADVAIEAADVVLMKSSLMDVPTAISLSRAALKNIHQNLFWAFFYNSIGIPLAAGAFTAFGLTLSPMFGAAAMSLSSFCVVSNALRLNFFKPYKTNPGRKPSVRKPAPQKPLRRTMVIEGMMCSHCENAVRSALEALPQVQSAQVSHTKGTAVVTLRSDIVDEALKKAVEAEDYTVVSICPSREK